MIFIQDVRAHDTHAKHTKTAELQRQINVIEMNEGLLAAELIALVSDLIETLKAQGKRDAVFPWMFRLSLLATAHDLKREVMNKSRTLPYTEHAERVIMFVESLFVFLNLNGHAPKLREHEALSFALDLVFETIREVPEMSVPVLSSTVSKLYQKLAEILSSMRYLKGAERSFKKARSICALQLQPQ